MPCDRSGARLGRSFGRIMLATNRVVTVADRYEDTADSQIASDLYAAERTLISALAVATIAG